jgi:type II secretory pathway pseudopilin PulG
MIVVAIIGLLAAIAVPKFADMVRRGKESAARGQLGAVRSAISIYYADNEGVFPTVPLGFDRTELIQTLTAQTKYLQRWVPLLVPTHHRATFTIDQVAHDDFFAIDPICDGEFVYVANRAASAWGEYRAVEQMAQVVGRQDRPLGTHTPDSDRLTSPRAR